MSDRPGATSRDFAFQTYDQAGGASQQHPQHFYGGYHAELDTNAPEAASQAHSHDFAAGYHDYNAAQHPVMAGQFAGLGFGSSVPTGWDAIDFTDFTDQYEPQGELVQEYQSQVDPINNFNIPLPVSAGEAAYQAFSQSQSVTPAPNVAQSQNQSSPPLPPAPAQQQQRPAIQAGTKRKVDTDSPSAAQQDSTAAENPPKRQNVSRQPSDASAASPVVTAPADAQTPAMTRTAATTETTPRQVSRENTNTERRKEQSKGTGPQGRVIDVSTPRRVPGSPGALDTLPAGKVFPIQIGSELFRLSGASISSDAPSHFSHFFGQQLHDNGGRAGGVRTLYIDRDPDTFRDIALHLQGYHITPRDGEHFVKLYADAQFYSLPRLTKQLFSTDIFVRIGGTPFQIQRGLFSAPGDSPNYFSLGFAHFFSTPNEAFPGLDRDVLLRPPSIKPPSVPSRDGEVFRELIQLLQGYNVEIRSDAHRSRLLRDARYFHLKGLEQKLIPCDISYNLKRQESEILIRLEDIRQSGISFTPDKDLGESGSGSESGSETVSRAQSTSVPPNPLLVNKVASPAPSTASSSAVLKAGHVSYARPYTDDHAHSNILVVEIASTEATTLFLPMKRTNCLSSEFGIELRATFHDSTLARVTSLFSVIASKMGLPATQPLGLMYLQSGAGVAAQPVSPANSGVSERRVRVQVDQDSALEIDGSPAELAVDEYGCYGIRSIDQKNKWFWGVSRGPSAEDEQWTVRRAHWRIRVEPAEDDADGKKMQVILCAVKLEAFTSQRPRNSSRKFLGGG
ncbi:BTB/POZ domain-containing protein [Alternaria rosae]|uniref:BTB/POZ domain-containing protein n=1 Tax=Alternaria rosae TaxID=1187941 RepID=UPI001E8D3782|nr:BTB/POZ domain-containing protein [Alternaria rosae]KAH6872300.1 BTB/POZ domain-containing protein [Alternaria rosae]